MTNTYDLVHKKVTYHIDAGGLHIWSGGKEIVTIEMTADQLAGLISAAVNAWRDAKNNP